MTTHPFSCTCHGWLAELVLLSLLVLGSRAGGLGAVPCLVRRLLPDGPCSVRVCLPDGACGASGVQVGCRTVCKVGCRWPAAAGLLVAAAAGLLLVAGLLLPRFGFEPKGGGGRISPAGARRRRGGGAAPACMAPACMAVDKKSQGDHRGQAQQQGQRRALAQPASQPAPPII